MSLRVSSLIVHQPHTTTTLQRTNNNVELVCRTCLKNCTTRLGIFNHRRDNVLVADMLVNCTSVEIHKEDGFPVNICTNCMKKLTSAFDFRTMVIESDIKLKELRQDVEVKKERELCNDDDDIENILVNEQVFIKIEETVVTDLGWKNENTLGNQTNKEEINVEVALEFESLDGIDCFFNDFSGATRGSEDSTETKNYGKIKEIGPDLHCESEDPLGNQAGKAGMNTQARLKFESLDENGDDFVEATSNPSEIKRTTPAAKQEKSQTYYDENVDVSDDSIGDSIGVRGCSKNSSERGNFEKVEEITAVEREGALGNWAGKRETDTQARLEFKSLHETGDVSNDSVEAATSNSGNPSEMKTPTTPAAKEEKTQTYYDEKNAELLNNPDFKRVMNGGLNNEKRQNETVFCPECNKTYSYKHYIAGHAYIHTGKLPYKCDKCEKCFPREALLRAHMKSHKFTCDVCCKSFFKKQDVRKHKAAKHSVKTVHKCDVCDRAFKASSYLARHSIIHAKEKENFVCTTCGKVLSRKRSLDSHMKMHLSENQHICKYCGKCCLHSAALKVHIQIHSTNSFACEVCGKTYSKRCLLNRHMSVHTSGTPHACEMCPSTFKYRNSLLKHIRHKKCKRTGNTSALITTIS